MAHRNPPAATFPARLTGCGGALVFLLLASRSVPASAQGLDAAQAFRTNVQGISAGRFLLYPSITIDSGFNDNVFYQSAETPFTDLISSGELVLAPRIMVDLPLSRSRVRFAYQLQYRDYSSDEYVPSEPLSHFFDLEASVRLGDAVTLALRDHYVQGTQEVQQFDPGGELRFGVVPFTLSEPSAEFTLNLGGRHRLSVLPRLSNLDFDDQSQTGFYDYERRGLTGRYAYQVDPSTVAYGSYYREDTDQDRDAANLGGVTADHVTVDTRRAGAGLQRSFAGSIASAVFVGYETQDYEGGSGGNYAGLVYDLNLAWAASDVYRFELIAARQPYQSYYINNNYYLSHSLKVRMAQQIGRTGFWMIGGGLQWNDYAESIDVRVTPGTPPEADLDNNGLIDIYESLLPSQGRRREDRAVILELGAGIRLRPTLRLSLGYNHEARDSNIEQSIIPGSTFEPLDYTVDRVFLRIEAGIL